MAESRILEYVDLRLRGWARWHVTRQMGHMLTYPHQSAEQDHIFGGSPTSGMLTPHELEAEEVGRHLAELRAIEPVAVHAIKLEYIDQPRQEAKLRATGLKKAKYFELVKMAKWYLAGKLTG